MKTRIIAFIVLCLSYCSVIAQDFSNQMEDSMYDSGRINVVIGVIVIIFLFFILYLFRLDKKVNKLEDDLSGQG